MNLAVSAIRRPVTTLVLMALIAAVGLVSAGNSSTDLLPDITMPVIAVVTTYSGAGAREVEALITRPVEQALGYVGGVESITSESSEGTSVVTAELTWGVRLDNAVLDVRDALELIKPYLPDDAGNPRVVKADLSLLPMMRITVAGPYAPLDLTRAAEKLRGRLERIEGVASATVGGGVYQEARVEVDPNSLLTYGLSIPTLSAVLRSENLSLPGGHLDEAGQRLVLRTQGQFTSVADIARVAVSTPRGGVVLLSDVASVELVETTSQSLTRLDAEPAVTVAVRKQSGTNTVQIAAAVRVALAELGAELPEGIGLRIVQDQSEYINRSLSQVAQNILIGGVLAILVLYLFLTEVRTVAVIAMAIPLSILATLAFMYFAGLTLNLVSLGGLALGVGMLVDNAIVILENIYRHRQLGLEPRAAAAVGTREVAAAVTASTLTTVVVFMPVVFVQGLASQIFRELALTVSFSLSSSLFVAMTFVPMAAAALLRARGAVHPTRFGRASQAYQERMAAGYRRVLGRMLDRRGPVIAVVVLFVAVSSLTAFLLPRSLLPQMDQREISIKAALPRGSSLQRTGEVIAQIEQVVAARSDVEFVFASSGASGNLGMSAGGSGDAAQVVVRLLARERGLAATETVVGELRAALAALPGATISVSARSSIVGEDQAFGAPLAVLIRGDDLGVLADLGEETARLMAGVPGLVNVRNVLVQAAPEVQITVDRSRAAQSGLGGAQVGVLVRAAVEGQVATTFRWADSDVDVRIIYPTDSIISVADIRALQLLTPAGQLVRVDEVAEVSLQAGPTSIQRLDGSRIAEVQAELDGIDLDTGKERAQAALAALSLPPGYTLEYGGESQEVGAAFGDLGQALIMAAFLIFMVMAAQFESVRQPLIIMVTVPLALAGAALGLALFGQILSIPSIVGVIALVGVVVNNGIVLLDYTNQLRARGLGVREALLEAGAVRLRPILMTSLTTIIGLLPMVLVGGDGSELQKALSVPLLAGLALATVLTLFVVPVLYTVLGGPAPRPAVALEGAGADAPSVSMEVS